MVLVEFYAPESTDMLQRSLLRVAGVAEMRRGRVFASSFVSSFERMVEDLPYREAVRYTADNKKLTAGQKDDICTSVSL